MTDDDWKKVSDHAKELDVIETALNKADVPVDVSLFTSEKVGQPYNMASRVLWLIGDRNNSTAERDQLRRMHDGVSADLDRERREHQEAMAKAAARELKLTEERDALQREIEYSDRRGGDLERQLNHFVSQRDAEVDALRVGFMKERDAAIQDVAFFKNEAEKAVANLTEVSAALDKASVPRSVDSMGNAITQAGRVAVLVALHERIAPPKRRSKTKLTKKPKAAAKRGRRKS